MLDQIDWRECQPDEGEPIPQLEDFYTSDDLYFIANYPKTDMKMLFLFNESTIFVQRSGRIFLTDDFQNVRKHEPSLWKLYKINSDIMRKLR